MSSSHRDPLDGLALLQGLRREALNLLRAGGTERRFAAGEALWTAGTRPRGLFIVLTGAVRVVRAPAGRQYVVHTEGPGGTLGEVPLFAGGQYPATALAAEPTVCLALSRETLARAIAADPELAFRLLGRLAERVRTVLRRLEGRTSETVPVRRAKLLLARAGEHGGAAIPLGATQAEVAEELGTVREVLVRGLRTLREAGLIVPAGRGRYTIPHPAALRAWAEAPRSPGEAP
ncbi:MAG TPA: Crp/Fnr family transcriptional regulator [Longimicrobium sp.]|jgi:CRP/FNR family transcriptional regulator|uniref:Crp/Fnr family transcriptional regulator n=1 Tax=Longimicrobium sp. TaxID=2029185 RepID=UPI002ED7C07F